MHFQNNTISFFYYRKSKIVNLKSSHSYMQWYNSKHKHFLNKESRNHFPIISININNIAIWTACSKTFLSRASDKILFFILQTRNKQRRVMVEGLSWPFLKNDLSFAILVQISNSMWNLIGPFSKKKTICILIVQQKWASPQIFFNKSSSFLVKPPLTRNMVAHLFS